MIKKIEAAQIEVLAKCNFRCLHCSNTIQPDEAVISLDKCKSIVAQLHSFGVGFIVISGGEPTLYDDLMALVKFIIRKGIKVQINTNGYLLDRHLLWLEKYKESVSLQVSLDGYDEESFFKIRRKNAFLKVMDNILCAKKCGITITIKTVLTRITAPNYEKFVKLSQYLETDISLSFIAKQGRAKEYEELLLSNEELIKYFNKINGEYEGFLAKGIFKKGHCPVIYSPNSVSVLRITNDGNCYPCIAFSGSELCMGNLYDMDLEHVLKKYISYKKNLLDILYNDKCLKCGLRKKAPRPGCIISCKYFGDLNCEYLSEGKI